MQRRGLSRLMKMFRKGLFIFAHQIGDRNFYPTYKKLVKNQWKSCEELKEKQEREQIIIKTFSHHTPILSQHQ